MISATSEEVGHVVRPGRSVSSGRPVIDRLIARGAVLRSPGVDAPVLVGEARWTSDGSLLLFAAFGEECRDIVCIRDSSAARVGEEGVMWLQGGAPVFQLGTIAHASLPDPDDYLVAWQLWQQVLPLKRQMIERCLDLVESQIETQ